MVSLVTSGSNFLPISLDKTDLPTLVPRNLECQEMKENIAQGVSKSLLAGVQNKINLR